ncbi:MAG: DEAD/DEAH box helicase, partial [Bacteroidota bacterium]
MERKTLFVDVLLPLPLKGLYTYRVPYEYNDYIIPGQRVAVQFGRRKIYTALVRNIHETVPQGYIPKYVLSILDEEAIVNETQFTFWDWISEYYMSHAGEVMNAALPSAFKLASESRLRLNPGFTVGSESLSEKEAMIAEALIHKEALTVKEASDITEQMKILPLINTLIEKQVIILEEELKDQYKARTEIYVRLAESFQSESSLEEIFHKLEKRAFRQLQVLVAYINMSTGEDSYPEVRKTVLLKAADATQAPLKELIKKGVFTAEEKAVSRLTDDDAIAEASDIVFNEHQLKTLEGIKEGFREKEVALLHGVTSSGKTEIYIHLIKEAIDQGKQVLYLLPEIALTTQIINRLRKYFGKQVGVYHSRYNERERVEIWNKVLSDEADDQYNIILGARSSIFLPFSRLGLVIVDEEHDQSY